MKDFVSFFLVLILITSFYTYLESKSLGVDYVESTIDNKKYLVRNYEDKQEAADLLANLSKRCGKLVDSCDQSELTDEDIKRLKKNFNKNSISESSPGNSYTSYSINKGDKLVFCIRDKEKDGHEKEELLDINTIMFVAIHELAHLATSEIGHTPIFWDNMKKLLKLAELKGIYKPIDYSKYPKRYCGMDINSTPIF